MFQVQKRRASNIRPHSSELSQRLATVKNVLLIEHLSVATSSDIEKMQNAIEALFEKRGEPIRVLSVNRAPRFSLPDLQARKAIVHCIREVQHQISEVIVLREQPAHVSIPLDTLVRALMAFAQASTRICFCSTPFEVLQILNAEQQLTFSEQERVHRWAFENEDSDRCF